MSLLKHAEKETAYLKAGLLGFAGTGKTYTASLIAAGISKKIGSRKPIAFLDTETGSDFVIDIFKRQGIELVVAKSRAFVDLLAVVEEAEKQCDVLIIDSISHVWQELLESYQKKHNLTRLAFHHWGPIKSEWRKFTDLYLCSRLHILMCGRAAWEYDYGENEEGERELIKTGTKMRAETEMGYEPSLLLEMVRIKSGPEPTIKRTKKGKREQAAEPAISRIWTHRCYVLKDRTQLLHGKVIDNPTFADFEVLINALNIGGEHRVLDTKRTSEEMIAKPDWSAEDRRRWQKVYSEEIEGHLISALPGQSAKDKKLKADIMQAVFNSRSWTAICDMKPETLREGAQAVKYLCEQITQTEEQPADVVSWLQDKLEDRRRGNGEATEQSLLGVEQ